MIFESHAHYDDEQFDEDREELLSSFKDNGIEYVVNVGASLEGCRRSLLLADKYDFIYAATGVHPSDCKGLPDSDMAVVEELAHGKKVVAVGEIGLDYYWEKDLEEREHQKAWFIGQMDIARRLKKPIIVHSREAAKDTLDIMKAEKAGEIGGVIHCFSYSVEMAREYLNMGYYLGIGGVITYKNARVLKEVAEYAPLDRILLETDCPYLTPVPNRGKRNSSLNIPYVAQTIADIKNISYEEVVNTTLMNAKRMYNIG